MNLFVPGVDSYFIFYYITIIILLYYNRHINFSSRLNHLFMLFFLAFHMQAYTQKKKLLNELKKIRVNFSTKFNYIFPPKSNLFEMSCCNLVV